jgi:hypothetical protein
LLPCGRRWGRGHFDAGFVGVGPVGVRPPNRLVGARVIDERPAELALALSDGPAQVDVAVVADVLDLDEHGIARFPVEAFETLV